MIIKIDWKVYLLLFSIALYSCDKNVKKDYWENGNPRSSLSYQDGKWHPNGKLESEMKYLSGMRNGMETIYDVRGNKISEAYYVNDTLDGSFRQWYSDGIPRVEGAYVKGLFDGQWLYYDANGNVVGIGNFEKGSGLQKGWWPNGNLKREINYRQNVKHGTEKWYDEQGELINTIEYTMGVPLEK
ncbi:MAG: hypothetical protein P8100_04205 [bacterium]